jgi:hypothetical protein
MSDTSCRMVTNGILSLAVRHSGSRGFRTLSAIDPLSCTSKRRECGVIRLIADRSAPQGCAAELCSLTGCLLEIHRQESKKLLQFWRCGIIYKRDAQIAPVKAFISFSILVSIYPNGFQL